MFKKLLALGLAGTATAISAIPANAWFGSGFGCGFGCWPPMVGLWTPLCGCGGWPFGLFNPLCCW